MKWNKKKYFTELYVMGLLSSFFIFFLVINSASASGLCFSVTGATTSNYNGTYTETGTTLNSYPQYGNGVRYLNPYVSGSNYWDFMPSSCGSGCDGDSYAYSAVATFATSPAGLTYLGDSGVSVSEVSCGGGGGASTTPDSFDILATSTVDSTQQTLFNGLVLFFISFFGILWIIRQSLP